MVHKRVGVDGGQTRLSSSSDFLSKFLHGVSHAPIKDTTVEEPTPAHTCSAFLCPCWCCCSKVVWLLSQLSDFYTTSVTAPLVTHWAQAMAWAVGQPGAAFDLQVGV
jgi:hypothetical protein